MADFKIDLGIADGKVLTDESVMYLSHIASRGIGSSLMSDDMGWLRDRELARRIMKSAGFADEEIAQLAARYRGYDLTPYYM